MIFPWGYANIKHENEDKMSELAYKMVNDIKWRTSDRELYVPGTAYQVLHTLLFQVPIVFYPSLVIDNCHKSFNSYLNIDFITLAQVFDRWGFAGGATDDWYSSIGIPYSYTWELPQEDKNGFHGLVLPPENIKRVSSLQKC